MTTSDSSAREDGDSEVRRRERAAWAAAKAPATIADASRTPNRSESLTASRWRTDSAIARSKTDTALPRARIASARSSPQNTSKVVA